MKHSIRATFCFTLAIALCMPSFAQRKKKLVLDTVFTVAELEKIFSTPVYNKEIFLQPGIYILAPKAATDSSCGNCQNSGEFVEITFGLYLTGKNITIKGPADYSAIIQTNAGYGLFLNHCENVRIENLSITSGARDTLGDASCAAIVVKNSTASITNNIISDNIGKDYVVNKTISGIMGICGRENAKLTISGNIIKRNSWDGIALYRNADAVISRNIIDGIDKSAGPNIGGGRGVGIGITHEATATVTNNLVTRYWKGIGVFANARATIENNIVEDVLTWGIALWDASDSNDASADIRSNIIYKTGACGASITCHNKDRHGEFTGNVISETGQNPRYDSPELYCYQCALAVHAKPESFNIAGNLIYNNRQPSEDCLKEGIAQVVFEAGLITMLGKFKANKVFENSVFLEKYKGLSN